MCKVDGLQEVAVLHWEFSLVTCDDLQGSDGGWEGGSTGRGYVFTQRLLHVVVGRNQHNTIKQLSSNEK